MPQISFMLKGGKHIASLLISLNNLEEEKQQTNSLMTMILLRKLDMDLMLLSSDLMMLPFNLLLELLLKLFYTKSIREKQSLH